MVAITSRVAFIAASISLTAISNAPVVEGVAIPVPVIARSQEVIRQAVVREDRHPMLSLPRAYGDSNREWKREKESKNSKKGENPVVQLKIGPSLVNVKVGLKRSAEQQYFHIRRGFPTSNVGRGPHRHKPSSSRRSLDLLSALKSGSSPPGNIELVSQQGSELKKYGKLFLDPSGEIAASLIQATIFYLIPTPCPDGCGFKSCVLLALFGTLDKNRCITYSSLPSQPSSLHGNYCWEKAMATEEAARGRSQVFGLEAASGRLHPLPNHSPASSQSFDNSALERKDTGSDATLAFTPLSEVLVPTLRQADIGAADSSSTTMTSASTGNGVSATPTISPAMDSSTTTATSTETTTLTVTVTEESEPTSSIGATSSAASIPTTSSPPQTELKVKVVGDSSSTMTGASSTTSAPATTVTPNSYVDGDVVASSIAAEDRSSNSASSTTTAAARR